MIIGDNQIETSISTPFEEHMDMMLGIAIEEGYTSCCNDPVIMIRVGILVLTLTIIIQKKHEHQWNGYF